MKRQPNRLPAEGEHRLKGTAIDRTKPLRFWLDGRQIHGFAGDTILSAALASGLVSAGTRGGRPLALDERYAPPIVVNGIGKSDAPVDPLPMARTPALDGLRLRSLGNRPITDRIGGRLRLLLTRHRHQLSLRHDSDMPLAPWLNTPPSETLAADIVVVGGGIAGMAAALAAAESGASVILIESRPWLGGAARLFGTTGEEEAPEAIIQRLSAAIAAMSSIRTLLCTEAFGVFPALVQVHRVVVEDNLPTGRVITIQSPRIVLANGALERLPVFAGNRRPGVVGLGAAYERAERFGVWIGRRALFATATSIAYRVAAQIKSEAVTVLKVADSRINPQSRFVEFGKAYGIPQAQDTIPLAAQASGKSSTELNILLTRTTEGGPALDGILADQFVAAGGWQADLTLWHMAGGTSHWDDAAHRFAAEGSLPGIALAGSAAGYETAAACLASGPAAIAALAGKRSAPIEETRIEALYETPDAPTPVAPQAAIALEPAYLDGGVSLTTRPEARAGERRRRAGRLTDEVRSLSLADVAAAVEIGLIPTEQAASIAQERCVTPGDLADAGRRAPPLPTPPANTGVPAYLAGRFGAESAVRRVEAADGRRLDIGCLIYANADGADPLMAMGVIFASEPSGRGAMALIGKAAANASNVSVRDISGPVSARLEAEANVASISSASEGGEASNIPALLADQAPPT